MGRHTTGENLEGNKYGRLLVLELQAEPAHRKHYLCLCDCGKTKIADGRYLKNGSIRSCGCLRNEKIAEHNKSRIGEIRVKKPDAVFNVLYNNIRSGANRRSYVFELTVDDVKDLSKQNCVYCGAEPMQKIQYKSDIYLYNGIDRVDNSVGYVKSNCVPCCGTCNRAKGSKTHAEFMLWIDRISKWHTGK